MHCRLLTQCAIIMVQFLAWLRKIKLPAGPGARTRDLPRAGRGSGAARQGGSSDKQDFPCL